MAPRKTGIKANIVARLVTGNVLPCAFCSRKVNDELLYGKLYAIGDIQCHYYCVLLSSCLIQKGKDVQGLFGFLYEDILTEVERCKKHKCSYCNQVGANLGCSISQCRKQFHLPCGKEKNSVSLFYGNYKSFCQLHAPKQNIPQTIMMKAKLRRSRDKKAKLHACNFKDLKELSMNDNSDDSDIQSVCVICYEQVEGYPTPNTFWPPCCARDAWFHRSCLQRMALSAGMHYLKCPLCNDKENFYEAVISQGYYVPDRDAAWELEQNAFAEIYERPVSCSAADCVCPMGRDHDAENGWWSLSICLLCGSSGQHPACAQQQHLHQHQHQDAHQPPSSLYICAVCKPAAPEDLENLAHSIEAVISQEESRTSSRSRRGPVMPSRMSLRRTKRHTNGQIPSCSTQQANSRLEDSTLDTDMSRRSLNLKPLRKTTTNNSPIKLSFSPQKNNNQKSPGKSPNYENKFGSKEVDCEEDSLNTLQIRFKKPQPMSLKRKTVNPSCSTRQTNSRLKDSSLDTDMSRRSLNLKPPRKPTRNNNSTLNLSFSPQKNNNHRSPGKCSNYESPMKILEEGLKNKFGSKEVDYKEDLLKELQMRFKKPQPMSVKRKIVAEILNGFFDNLLQDPKQKEPIKPWCSPKKDNDISEDVIEIPQPPAEIIDLTEIKRKEENQLKTESNPTPSQENIETSYPILHKLLETPKKLKTFDIEKDSSLEISANNEIVNVNVIKIENKNDLLKSNSESPLKKNSCTLKLSPLNKELLDTKNIDIDLDTFKKHYLKEVNGPNKKNILKKRKLDKDKIVVKYESKKRKMKRQSISIKNKDIRVKIKWRKERLNLQFNDIKSKKKVTKLKQCVIQYSPENRPNIGKSDFEVTPRKRKYMKQEKSPDTLIQTSIQHFFKPKPLL